MARLCVGLGLLWALLVVTVGLAGGLDAPAAWFGLLLDQAIGPRWRQWLYRLLSYVVVPVGMLTYLRDILRDPLPLWVKASAPGALVAVYGLFLAAANPEIGTPLLVTADPLAAWLAPTVRLERGVESARSWLLRFVAAFLLLAGAPGLLGAVAGWLGGLGGARGRQ